MDVRKLMLIVLVACLTQVLSAQSYVARFIGHTTLAEPVSIDGVPVGGFSALTYDAARQLYYVLSDDFGKRGPARFYRLRIALQDDQLSDGDVSFQGVTILTDHTDAPFVKTSIDPEGICLIGPEKLVISSEGSSDTRYKPFIRNFGLDGASLADFPIPNKFLPTEDRDHGVLKNRAFEALCVGPQGRYIFSANEEALAQDGPQSDVDVRSPVRILRYDMQAGGEPEEFLYWTDPVHAAPRKPDGSRNNGVPELLALSESSLLVMERSYAQGRGTEVRLYLVKLDGASRVEDVESLKAVDLHTLQPLNKTLLLDFTTLGVPLDNLEGMCFGPELSTGERALVVVSDDNFSDRQVTQFLAFGFSQGESVASGLTIPEIQGRAHRSPFVGRRVRKVSGVVTGISQDKRNLGFWVQAASDGNPASSEGIFISTGEDAAALASGDWVAVDGTVAERRIRNGLTTTQINADKLTKGAHNQPLPEPTTIGKGGRVPPSAWVDDDGMSSFECDTDAIDFFESLEGMLVRIRNPVVCGPTSRFGDFVVLADGGADAIVRTPAGGILLRENDVNPERIIISSKKSQNRPAANVGDRFTGDIVGVVDYNFGSFRVAAVGSLPQLVPANRRKASTALVGNQARLTVATFNAENLDAQDAVEKFDALANSIVQNLASPDILALQEVQDDNGAIDDGVVDASLTFKRLISAVVDAGGPTYDFVQVNPEDKKDGGQPGGNIRVGFLYNSARVTFTSRGAADALGSASISVDSQGPHLSPNPGRVNPGEPSFARTRKSLAAEFEFNGQRIFIINNHFSSKGGDDAIFGAHQPQRFGSEVKRRKQASAIQSFVAELLQWDATANVLVVGDLNEHQFRRPVQLLAADNMSGLIDLVPETERYTYVYNGNSQILDHILVSSGSPLADSPEVEIVHINADFAHDHRASDHDPVIARFVVPVATSGKPSPE